MIEAQPPFRIAATFPRRMATSPSATGLQRDVPDETAQDRHGSIRVASQQPVEVVQTRGDNRGDGDRLPDRHLGRLGEGRLQASDASLGLLQHWPVFPLT